ncbi:MAG: SGNH/GDSL hydrolase family protein [Victivallales bacterium]|nr:SGNH/GDSL hydrolase family protein [Victivallales bacterium]
MAKYTILFQGDSITDCGRSREENLPIGVGLGAGYPNLIAARLLASRTDIEWNIINRAISGNRVVDLYARWKLDALNLNPDLISIMIGVNDTWHEKARQNGVEVPRYARIYRELLQWTRDTLPNVKLVLMEPYVHVFGAVDQTWVDEINQRRDAVRQLATDFNAVFIPSQAILDKALERAPQEHWTKDGVHPTLAGHQLFADEWLKAVTL